MNILLLNSNYYRPVICAGGPGQRFGRSRAGRQIKSRRPSDLGKNMIRPAPFFLSQKRCLLPPSAAETTPYRARKWPSLKHHRGVPSSPVGALAGLLRLPKNSGRHGCSSAARARRRSALAMDVAPLAALAMDAAPLAALAMDAASPSALAMDGSRLRTPWMQLRLADD